MEEEKIMYFGREEGARRGESVPDLKCNSMEITFLDIRVPPTF